MECGISYCCETYWHAEELLQIDHKKTCSVGYLRAELYCAVSVYTGPSGCAV